MIPADPAALKQVVLPITNDSASDGQPFGYRAEYLRGDATPPANDVRSSALAVTRGVEATTNNVYAGGRGYNNNPSDEAPDCPPAQDATRGVWFRFTTEGSGVHTYSAQAQRLPAGRVAVPRGQRRVRRLLRQRSFAGEQGADITYDVYVGRKSTDTGFGTTARLVVNGPGRRGRRP